MTKTINDVLEYLYTNGQKELAEAVLNLHTQKQSTYFPVQPINIPSVWRHDQIICQKPIVTTTTTFSKNKSYGASA